LNHEAVWKYRSIRNPYINPNIIVTNISETDDNPILDVPEVQPIAPEYNDEIYLSNRLLAFERDEWKCTHCCSRGNFRRTTLNQVPQGGFDPSVIHRVENFRTPCATCHLGLPKNVKAVRAVY
jgi:hypothetical protein